MDRSMDSIGSCSLDVDAESSDISDTSGSLNFPTPISIKDITREFTNNIRERCSVQTVKNTTAYVDPVTGQVCIALTQPTSNNNNNIGGVSLETSPPLRHQQPPTTLLSPQTPEDNYDKKPSYLNLACCVNGYSNITTYDSKIRQDINKSREVSPIRPSSSSLQYCKKSNSLAPPVLLAMPNINLTSPQQQTQYQMGTNGLYTTTTTTTIGSKYSILENNNHHSQNGLDAHNTSDDNGGAGSGGAKRSFIQQRVERLYGPGALAQGFYSPKKMRDPSTRLNKSEVTGNVFGGVNDSNGGCGATSELARKFQELSPSKDYNQFRKKLSNGRPSLPTNSTSSSTAASSRVENTNSENNNIDLPCLRHLSQEFRAQLPMVSPKRNFSRTSPGRDVVNIQPQTHTTAIISGTATETATTTPPPSNTNGTIITTPPPTISTSQVEQQHEQQHQHHKSQILNSSSTTTSSTPPATLDLDELDHKVVVVVEETIVPSPTAIIDLKKVLPPTPATLDSPQISPTTISTEKTTAADDTKTNGSSSSTTDGVKDAHYFLKQLKDEQKRLLNIAVEIEKYLDALTSDPDITEDTLGILRSASGKARLLVAQKMKQFEGLCHNNLNSTPEDQFPTTVDDLQGFWDMVYLQVDHVDALFADIEAMKKNDWKKPVEDKPAASLIKTPRANKTPLTSKTKSSAAMTNGASATPSAAALRREAQRKKLQEMKRRNREALAANANGGGGANDESSTILIANVADNTNNDINIEQTTS